MRKAHHAQFLATPLSLTKPVTKLGVSAEKVHATIETPSNHQGISLPPKKNSSVLSPAVREAHQPIPKTMTKNILMIIQSMVAKIIK